MINSNDQNKSKTNSQNKSKSQIKNKCTSNPNDQAHQCIARSDGVVRALRARTGDQQQPPFKIVSEGS